MFLMAIILAFAQASHFQQSEEVAKMAGNFIQPYCNAQLNSSLQYNLSAKGLLSWKLTYNEDSVDTARSLLLIDDARAVLVCSETIHAVDLYAKKIISSQGKSQNTFAVIGNNGDVYFFPSSQLSHLNFNSFQNYPEESYFVPALSNTSVLRTFIPYAENFIVGIQTFGNPIIPKPAFVLLRKHYLSLNDIWNFEFLSVIPAPPMSLSGDFVLAQKDKMTIISDEGQLKNEFEGEFNPVSCSIGINNLIYMICKSETGFVIKAIDFNGNVQWECPTSITKLNQPPIVSSESIVYIIGSSKVEAFADGEKLWEYELIGDSRQLASVSNDGMLLVSDGNGVICLNKAGELSWKIKSGSGETFLTQPVLDSVGNVLVATDKSIVVLQ